MIASNTHGGGYARKAAMAGSPVLATPSIPSLSTEQQIRVYSHCIVSSLYREDYTALFLPVFLRDTNNQFDIDETNYSLWSDKFVEREPFFRFFSCDSCHIQQEFFDLPFPIRICLMIFTAAYRLCSTAAMLLCAVWHYFFGMQAANILSSKCGDAAGDFSVALSLLFSNRRKAVVAAFLRLRVL